MLENYKEEKKHICSLFLEDGELILILVSYHVTFFTILDFVQPFF